MYSQMVQPSYYGSFGQIGKKSPIRHSMYGVAKKSPIGYSMYGLGQTEESKNGLAALALSPLVLILLGAGFLAYRTMFK